MSVREEVKEIKMSKREWDRIGNRGVGRSFCKTITEPVTNSDTSYKRKLNISMSTGLVDKMLETPIGRHLDSSALKKEMFNKTVVRQIIVELSTTKRRRDMKCRECRVMDHAEGMDYEALASFSDFAGDKSKVSKGKPGRSLFGRGLADVLIYHGDSAIYTTVGDTIFSAEGFSHDKGTPSYNMRELGKATSALRKKYDLPLEGNGTTISFRVSDECSIPGKERLGYLLSNFYMLRLINSDPNTQIIIRRYDGPGKPEEFILDYDFPQGQVIGRIKTTCTCDYKGKQYKLDVEGIVIRSDSPLRGSNGDIDARENGLLIVDNNDAVLDQSLLQEYEKAPYLQNIFGIVRVNGIRQLLFDYLEGGKEAFDVLTVSRDGFDPNHDVTKKLFRSIGEQVKPIYEREKELYEQKQGGEHSAEIQTRIKDALKPLNKFFNTETEETGDVVDEGDIDESRSMQFVPDNIYLRVKRERSINLFLKSDDVQNDEIVLIGSDNKNISVRPDSFVIDKRRANNGKLKYRVYLLSDTLHQHGKVTAITPAAGTGIELAAALEITDVKDESIVIPPREMEFRPETSSGLPNKKSSTMLYINLDRISLGRQIKIAETKVRGNIVLLDADRNVDQIKITLSKSHVIAPGLAKIPIYFLGSGKGQHATIVAETKTQDGISRAEGKIRISEPEPEGTGIFQNSEYIPLDQKVSAAYSEGTIYVNSGHPINKKVFGMNKEQFDKSLLEKYEAQLRYAEIILDVAVFYTAQVKERKGGDKGLIIRHNLYVQSIQDFVDGKKFDLAPSVYKAIVRSY